MKLYIVLSDERENPNNVIITTNKEEVALNAAAEYLQKQNIGKDNFWETVDEYLKDINYYDSFKEGILNFCNNAWLDSPIYIEYELDRKGNIK